MEKGQTIRVPRALLEATMPSYLDVEVVEVDKEAHVARVRYALTKTVKVRLADLSQTAGASRALEVTPDPAASLPPNPEGESS